MASDTLLQSTMDYFMCSLEEAEFWLQLPVNHAMIFENGIVYTPQSFNINK